MRHGTFQQRHGGFDCLTCGAPRTPADHAGPRPNRHLTLAFLGNVPDGTVPDLEADVAARARDVEPFVICLAGGGAYRSTVMRVGVGGQA